MWDARTLSAYAESVRWGCALRHCCPHDDHCSRLQSHTCPLHTLPPPPPPPTTNCSLEELWLAGNPLLELPDSMGELRALRVLDLRRTRLRRVPNAVSRLPRLLVLDLAGTSLRGDFQTALQDGGPAALLGLLGREDERLQLLQQLREALRRRVFVADADTAGGAAAIDALADRVMKEFPVSAELRTVIRNAERVFADPLERANATAARDRYIALSKDTRRRQLGAEAELVIKAAYFGRADREVVSGGGTGKIEQRLTRWQRDAALIRSWLHHALPIACRLDDVLSDGTMT